MASTSKEGLCSEHNIIIEQFCLVTGTSDEKAQKLLEVCNWNLEMAINMHVDSDLRENPDNPNALSEEIIRDPIPQSRAVLVEEDVTFHYGLRGRKRRPHNVFDAFRDFQAEAQIQQNESRDNSEISKKRRTLEDLYRPPLDLMHRGNFNSARDLGQMFNKWLMVNLQDSQEFSCQVLNRDVWSNLEVKKLISQHFVFWQVYNDSVDGEKYIQFYSPHEFPYIAIIDPRTGEKLVTWHKVDSTSLCELIENFLREFRTPDGTSTSIKNPPVTHSLLDQSEEEQLKAAIEASVKESSLVNIDDNDSDLETFDSDTESTSCKISSMTCANVYSDHSNDTIDVVGISESNEKEPVLVECSWKDFLGAEKDPKSDLVLRLPDGKREQVTWPCTTKLKSLLLYITEIGYSPEKYELVTNYPRRNLCQLDLLKTLKEVDLYPREMIIVQLKT